MLMFIIDLEFIEELSAFDPDRLCVILDYIILDMSAIIEILS